MYILTLGMCFVRLCYRELSTLFFQNTGRVPGLWDGVRKVRMRFLRGSAVRCMAGCNDSIPPFHTCMAQTPPHRDDGNASDGWFGEMRTALEELSKQFSWNVLNIGIWMLNVGFSLLYWFHMFILRHVTWVLTGYDIMVFIPQLPYLSKFEGTGPEELELEPPARSRYFGYREVVDDGYDSCCS